MADKEHSTRKWKEKIKEWKLEKNVPSSDMSFIVAKAEKRKSEEGKETTFYRGGILVDRTKIEQSKKRKITAAGSYSHVVPGESRIIR